MPKEEFLAIGPSHSCPMALMVAILIIVLGGGGGREFMEPSVHTPIHVSSRHAPRCGTLTGNSRIRFTHNPSSLIGRAVVDKVCQQRLDQSAN